MSTKRTAVMMFAILLLSYVVNAMDRQLFSVLAPEVKNALGLTLPQVGLAATVFTLGMGVAGIPTGWLLGVMPRRGVAALGLVIFSVATYLTAYSQGLADLLLYRFISGLGEAMQLTALFAIATTYFEKNRAVSTGAINFTFGIGAALGPNLGVAILGATHWQTPFVVFGLSGILPLVLMLLFVKPWFTEVEAVKQAEQAAPDMGVADSVWSFAPMMLALATAFAGLSIYGYLGLYPTFLRGALGFSPAQAGLAVSFYGFGALLSLLGGWLGDKYSFRRVLVAALIVSAVTGGLLFTGLGGSHALHNVFSFAFGGAISGMVYANLPAALVRSVKREKAAAASGLFVASLYIPAAFAGYVLGVLKESVGWSAAGIIQVSGCAIVAAVITLATGAARQRKVAYA